MTEHPPINLELLRPSRRRLAAGDVFVVKPIRHPFLFGRIIRTDAALFGQGNLLLYFYDAWSDDAQDVPASRTGSVGVVGTSTTSRTVR